MKKLKSLKEYTHKDSFREKDERAITIFLAFLIMFLGTPNKNWFRTKMD